MIERGRTSLRRSNEMVRGMLEFTRAGARPKTGGCADVAVMLADVADEVAAEAEKAHVVLRVGDLPDEVVACDPGILHSIVVNLTRNAVKYTGAGGEGHVELRAEARGPLVRIEVEDDGPGVREGEEEVIFEPYVRGADVAPDGLGLGLATVKRLAVAYGGRVGVQRAGSRGSIFWVELPRLTT